MDQNQCSQIASFMKNQRAPNKNLLSLLLTFSALWDYSWLRHLTTPLSRHCVVHHHVIYKCICFFAKDFAIHHYMKKFLPLKCGQLSQWADICKYYDMKWTQPSRSVAAENTVISTFNEN